MMIPLAVQGYVKAEPFRPFVLRMASGRTYEVRHPEMINVLKSYALVFKSPDESSELPDEFVSVSLMLAESIELLEPSTR